MKSKPIKKVCKKCGDPLERYSEQRRWAHTLPKGVSAKSWDHEPIVASADTQ